VVERRDFLKLAALSCLPLGAAPAAGTFPTQIARRVTRAFSTPGAAPNGLQATSDGLWVLDQATNQAALVQYEDGRVIRQFDTETDRGSGITFDGSAVWIASTYNRLLVQVDAQTGRTLKKMPSPGSGLVKWGPRSTHPEPTGAHGDELWVAVPPAVRVFLLDAKDGNQRRSFPAPGVRPHGIGWDPDGSLWVTESIYRSFFKMEPASGKILTQLMLPPEAPLKDGVVLQPHGMTVWRGDIWFSVAETGEIYRVPLPA
jgi:sugar lactone lactonase YvrE